MARTKVGHPAAPPVSRTDGTGPGDAGTAAIPPRPALDPPCGLVVETFDEGGEVFALLEWPVARPAPRAERPGVRPVPPCAPAQRAVLELLLRGFSNAEIARRRGRSERTVAHQVDALFRRLGVGSRSELFALAAREGWTRGTT